MHQIKFKWFIVIKVFYSPIEECGIMLLFNVVQVVRGSAGGRPTRVSGYAMPLYNNGCYQPKVYQTPQSRLCAVIMRVESISSNNILLKPILH